MFTDIVKVTINWGLGEEVQWQELGATGFESLGMLLLPKLMGSTVRRY